MDKIFLIGTFVRGKQGKEPEELGLTKEREGQFIKTALIIFRLFESQMSPSLKELLALILCDAEML